MKHHPKLPTMPRHFAVWVKTDNGKLEIRSTHTNRKDACKNAEALLAMGYKEIHVIDSTPID